ncbi:uncharacterized protein [Littorina saxatilis]|uniref:uncharacterized protein isoform X2 n=1 Tax=Littorina saxatilis TaxID=31220 RepID=UPI0038B678E7
MDAKPKKATRAATSAKNLKRKKEETPASDISDMAAAGGDNANAKKTLATSSEETKVHIDSGLTQKDLEELAASERGKRATELHIVVEYDDDTPIIDFGVVSFPNLETLDVNCQAVKAFNFQAKDYPKLRHLTMENVVGNIECFDFDLPCLETISLQFVEVVDPAGFGKSISRSPRLTSFSSYKLWGLYVGGGKYHTLVLPNCHSLSLYRSDDLDRLKLWAPMLTSLDLQACYGLREVIILNRKPAGYQGKEYEFHGQPSLYGVNIVNTCSRPKGNVLTHPRCASIDGNDSGDEGPQDACSVF